LDRQALELGAFEESLPLFERVVIHSNSHAVFPHVHGVPQEQRMAASRRRTKTLIARRSPKAGSPPRDIPPTPRERRRQKTAHVAVRKDTMLMQTADGPRVRWAVTKPKVKKR
jgi:hypothetical protein